MIIARIPILALYLCCILFDYYIKNLVSIIIIKMFQFEVTYRTEVGLYSWEHKLVESTCWLWSLLSFKHREESSNHVHHCPRTIGLLTLHILHSEMNNTYGKLVAGYVSLTLFNMHSLNHNAQFKKWYFWSRRYRTSTFWVELLLRDLFLGSNSRSSNAPQYIFFNEALVWSKLVGFLMMTLFE